MSFPIFSFNLLNSGVMWEVDPNAANTTYLKPVTQVGLTFRSNDFDDVRFHLGTIRVWLSGKSPRL